MCTAYFKLVIIPHAYTIFRLWEYYVCLDLCQWLRTDATSTECFNLKFYSWNVFNHVTYWPNASYLFFTYKYMFKALLLWEIADQNGIFNWIMPYLCFLKTFLTRFFLIFLCHRHVFTACVHLMHSSDTLNAPLEPLPIMFKACIDFFTLQDAVKKAFWTSAPEHFLLNASTYNIFEH